MTTRLDPLEVLGLRVHVQQEGLFDVTCEYCGEWLIWDRPVAELEHLGDPDKVPVCDDCFPR